MRLLADTNVTAATVRALRSNGYDVLYAAERPSDPGDLSLLREAVSDARVLITKDADFGRLVFQQGEPHCGTLFIEDLGDPLREANLVLSVLEAHGAALANNSFIRAGAAGVRIGA